MDRCMSCRKEVEEETLYCDACKDKEHKMGYRWRITR